MKIYVGNLNNATDDTQLNEAFTAHGNVSSASVVRHRDTQESRGFGFVEMSDAANAQAAIAALNGATLGGNVLTVSEARPREAGQGGRR